MDFLLVEESNTCQSAVEKSVTAETSFFEVDIVNFTSSDQIESSKDESFLDLRDTVVGDKFCWYCHLKDDTGTETLRCSDCPRVYHANCIEINNKTSDVGQIPSSSAGRGKSWTCLECQKLAKAKSFRADLDRFCLMLDHAILRLKFSEVITYLNGS